MTLPSSMDGPRVAVYIRWSTEEQSDGTTLEVQSEACRLFVRSQGWLLSENLVFVDDGYSGGTLDRPGLTRLRQAVGSGGVNCVVVYKLDRLSRSVLDTVNLVLQEWDGICAVRSAREPVDTSNPTGSILFYMLASYAEWERSTIRERTLSGKIKRAQQGRNPGVTPPYGYRKGRQPGEWLVDEAEATVVQRIFREYGSGRGVYSIARGLCDDGICPRKGGAWRPEWLARLVQNPVYTGLLRYGLTTGATKAQRLQGSGARIAFPAPRYASVAGALPAIVSEETFALAQQVRQTRNATAGCRARSAEFLLTGIARCRCGAPLRGDRRYYRCTNARPSRLERCDTGLIPAGALEDAVLAKVQEVLGPAARLAVTSGWESEMRKRAASLVAELRRLQADLAFVGKAKARLLHDYRTGDLPAKLFAAQMAGLDQDDQRLQAGRVRVATDLDQTRRTARESLMDTRDDRRRELLEKLDPWAELTPEERKQVLRLALASCVAYRAPRRCSPPIEVTLTFRTTNSR